MKNYLVALIVLICLAAGPAFADTGLAKYLPEKAIVYLETNDLMALLQKIENSGLQAKFSKSKVYEDFSKSKLYLKLADRISSLEENTGFGLTFDRLKNLAGNESALALYNIGELQMTLITKVGQQKVNQSSLWSLRDSFDTRKFEGLKDASYFVKEDPYGRANLAFAFIDDLLVISTDVLRFEQTLSLIAGSGTSLAKQIDFSLARQLWAKGSNLRMYLNQQEINKTPHFRSYWIYGNQGNFGDIYFGSVSLELKADSIIEQRLFSLKAARSWTKLNWGNSLENYSPVAISTRSIAENELAGWVNRTFGDYDKKEQKSLAELFSKAKPVATAQILEKYSGGKAGITHVIQFESPSAFTVADFEKIIANHISTKLLPEFARNLSFVDSGDMRKLDIPLMEENAPAYVFSNGILHYKPVFYLSESYITRATSVADDTVAFSSVDPVLLKTVYESTTRELTDVSAWAHSAGKNIVTENVPAMLELVGDVKSIETTTMGKDSLLSQKIIYYLK